LEFSRPASVLLHYEPGPIAAFLISLAACGNGSDVGGGEAGLAISITGLPAGADADVVVTGPGDLNRNILASQTLANVPPGVYSLVARNALKGSAIFAPRVASQSVVVMAGGVTPALVAYEPVGTLRLGLQQIASGVVAPLFLTLPPAIPGSLSFERAGRVRVIKNGVVLPTPVLDISTRVTTGGEAGLLSLAFESTVCDERFPLRALHRPPRRRRG